jgi:hypothetical protein
MGDNDDPAPGLVSSGALREATGRDWAGWVEALDAAGAAELAHGEIVAHLAREHPEVPSGWWRQTIAVGYERVRRRPTITVGYDRRAAEIAEMEHRAAADAADEILGILLVFLLLPLLLVTVLLVTGLVLGLREMGVRLPCVSVRDPATAARERVERDIAERGGRDAVVRVRELSEDAAFIVRTERDASYRVSERLLAGPAVCSGMTIDAVRRPR